MNPEVKAQWIAALRSGAYKQGRGRLHRVTTNQQSSYCCLGVLCELALAAGITSREKESSYADYLSYGGWSSIPPPEVCEWVGITSSSSLVEELIDLNDTAKQTFPAIATYLEERE